MNKRCALMVLGFFGVLGSGPERAQAAVLHFDDISATGGAPVPGTYGGFSWESNVWFVENDEDYFVFYGNSYGSPSGEFAAFNASGITSVSLTRSADFGFVGAFFTGWAENDGTASFTSSTVTVEGWNNGVQVGTVTMALPTSSYAWLAAGPDFSSVDELRFLNDGADLRWWLMDDFTYVPEPSSTALVGLCFLALAGLPRRR